MASMDCVLHVLLRVMVRRTICRLQEVVGMALEIGTALFVAVRVSGLVSRRPPPMSSSSSRAPSISGAATTTYYYSPAATSSLIAMSSRIGRH
ncbi:hypothetical protein BAE44_0009890 [Dichanthelium oligosanthes]|uniref:Uncharacterized protein n=1 Tax=Dichanthelium oligosanthes TaxID=888268 RepID=A0A1E5VVH7_9POAL|nr:hypothetical protein BAE44_0009890 [Dichanthelium oligosanthes]